MDAIAQLRQCRPRARDAFDLIEIGEELVAFFFRASCRAGDDGAGPLPLGAVNELPGEDYLDFLFEFCGWYTPDCFRDAHFMDPDDPSLGSGP